MYRLDRLRHNSTMKRIRKSLFILCILSAACLLGARALPPISRVRIVPTQAMSQQKATASYAVQTDTANIRPTADCSGAIEVQTVTFPIACDTYTATVYASRAEGFAERICVTVKHASDVMYTFTPSMGSGYEPRLTLLAFDDTPTLLYQCATGGNAGMCDTAVYRMLPDRAQCLYSSMVQTKDIPYHAEALDGFRARILGKEGSCTVDLSTMPADLLATAYQEDGTLFAEPDLWVGSVITAIPYAPCSNGWQLAELREVCWGARVNRIGYVLTPLRPEGDGFVKENYFVFCTQSDARDLPQPYPAA